MSGSYQKRTTTPSFRKTQGLRPVARHYFELFQETKLEESKIQRLEQKGEALSIIRIRGESRIPISSQKNLENHRIVCGNKKNVNLRNTEIKVNKGRELQSISHDRIQSFQHTGLPIPETELKSRYKPKFIPPIQSDSASLRQKRAGFPSGNSEICNTIFGQTKKSDTFVNVAMCYTGGSCLHQSNKRDIFSREENYTQYFRKTTQAGRTSSQDSVRPPHLLNPLSLQSNSNTEYAPKNIRQERVLNAEGRYAGKSRRKLVAGFRYQQQESTELAELFINSISSRI